MKLVDFNDFEPMNELRSRMGAELISKFQGTWDSISEEELESQLRTTGVLVDFNDIVFNDVGYSTYKNKLVLFYIKTQIARYFYMGYKFHFSKCSTISSAIDDNRNSRYVISKRTDGIFNVILRSDIYEEEEREVELKPCKNCLNKVNYKGYALASSTERSRIYNQFDIAEFIDSGIEGSGDSTLSFFRHEDLVGVDDYPENFSAEIRPKAMEYYDFKCNQCSIELRDYTQYLQIHHRNADKSNNKMSNLELLCIECHSNQKGHGHDLIKTSRLYKEFMGLKSTLR